MIRVMLVATHSEVREGLAAVLRLADGLEVSGTAGSLVGAVTLAREGCPGVVLVDLEMPGGEGYETIRELKRVCPGAQAIALTAHDYPAAREKALGAGACRVIVKGLDFAELVAAIEIVVGSPLT